MNIPRYWARANGKVERGERAGLQMTAWGWSDESKARAERHAESRLRQVLDRVATSGELPQGYGYGDRPLREERLESIAPRAQNGARGDRQDEPLGLVTRNAAGCEVLNTDQAMFLDFDDPPPERSGLLSFFRRERALPPGEKLLEDLRTVLAPSGLALRIYRTKNGYRVLATGEVIAPTDRIAQQLLALPQVDPSYRTLCRTQESFRARLQPKPWRCGVGPPPARYPFAEHGSRERFDEWLRHFEMVASDYATCELVEQLGDGEVAPRLGPLIELHDERCAVGTQRPLA